MIEEEFAALVESVGGTSSEAADAARARWDALAKPLGSLGLLEESIIKIAALTGTEEVRLDRRTLMVFCADNGVVSRGVSQCGHEVTAAVARALAEGRSTVCPMARLAGCSVLPVDVGMKDFSPFPGVLDRRVRDATADIAEGPAMTREECLTAILAGASLAQELSAGGTQLLAAGEMSIGNTTTAAAVTSCLLDLAPERVAGRGAGLSAAGLKRKVQAIEAALRCNAPDRRDAADVLAKVGGLDIAAMCGAFLGAAAARTPILIDGMISAAAALCAVWICPQCRDALFASHVSPEPAGRLLLEALGLKPLITAEMRLGEGSGAVAALPLLDMALAVYHSGQSFARLGIAAYTKQE